MQRPPPRGQRAWLFPILLILGVLFGTIAAGAAATGVLIIGIPLYGAGALEIGEWVRRTAPPLWARSLLIVQRLCFIILIVSLIYCVLLDAQRMWEMEMPPWIWIGLGCLWIGVWYLPQRPPDTEDDHSTRKKTDDEIVGA